MKRLGRFAVNSVSQFGIPEDAPDYAIVTSLIKKIRQMVDEEFKYTVTWIEVQELMTLIDQVNGYLVKWDWQVMY